MVLHMFSCEFMVNVTIAVPVDLKQQLDTHPEINWSEVARQAWKQKLSALDLLNEITAASKASDEDVNQLAAVVKKGVANWHNQKLRATK